MSRPNTRSDSDSSRWYGDPFRLAMASVLFLTVSRLHQYIPALGRVSPVLLLTAAAMAYLVLRPKAADFGAVVRYWPPKVILAFLAFACVAVPFSLSIGASASGVLRGIVRFVVLALLLVVGLRTIRDLRLFVGSYVAACGALVVIALFVARLTGGVGGGKTMLVGLESYDTNDLAVALLMGMPLVMLVTHATRSVWRKGAGLLLLAGMGVALARTGSRGGFLGLIVSGLALLLLLRSVPLFKRVGAVAVLGLALAVSAPAGFWQQMESLTEPTEDYNWDSYYGRRQLATRGLGYMLENPVFGVGVGNFARADATLSEQARLFEGQPQKAIAMGYTPEYRPAHNSFVTIGAELGIPGLVLWSSLLFGGIVGLRRLRRRLPERWLYGDEDERFLYFSTLYLPVAIIGFAVTAFFLNFTYMVHIYILAAFVTGVYAAAERKRRAEAPAPPVPYRPFEATRPPQRVRRGSPYRPG